MWEESRNSGSSRANIEGRTIGYFVTTPNKFFPIEPHTLLPLISFCLERWQRKWFAFLRIHDVYEGFDAGARDLRGCFQGQNRFDGIPYCGNKPVRCGQGEQC